MNINKFIDEQVSNYLLENELMNEGVSDIAYHFTSRENMYKILRYNQFKLSPATDSTEKMHNRGKLYFMSTTRSKGSGYFTTGNVKIVLDTKKMSQKYKFVPVNYMGGFRSSEQEDRIISNNRIIPNALSYIKELHILKSYYYDSIKPILFYCIKYQIPFYVYLNKEDLLNQKNPLDYDAIKLDLPDADEYLANTEIDELMLSDYDFDSCMTLENMRLMGVLSLNNINNYISIKNYLKKNVKSEELYNKFIGEIDGVLDVYKNIIEENEIFGYIKSHISKAGGNIPCKDLQQFLFRLLAKDFRKRGLKDTDEYAFFKVYDINGSTSETKKNFIDYLSYVLDDVSDFYFRKYFQPWIVTNNGTKYNNAYEVPEIINLKNKYTLKIGNLITESINEFLLTERHYELFEIETATFKLKIKDLISDLKYDGVHLKNASNEYASLVGRINDKLDYYDLVNLIFEKFTYDLINEIKLAYNDKLRKHLYEK